MDLGQLPSRLVAFISVSVFVCLAFAAKALVVKAIRDAKVKKLPLLRVDGDGEVLSEGYKRYKNELHRIDTPDGIQLVVPNRYLEELRRIGDDKIDMLFAFQKTFENEYTGLFPVQAKTTVVNSVVKNEITKYLGELTLVLSEAVERAVLKELPDSTEWTPININDTLFRIVSIGSGAAFVGHELSQHEEYIRIASEFTHDLIMAVGAVKKWPVLLRPLAKYFDPFVVATRRHRKAMKDFLEPVINQRRAAKLRGEKLPKEDALLWMMERSYANGVDAVEDIVNMQLLLTLAAIHTATLTTTWLIYDLVSRPEVIRELRNEIRRVQIQFNGEMSTTALYELKLLDSVMTESQRIHPPFLDAFRRWTKKDVTLSDGTVLPGGYMIQAANQPVLMDPDLYPNPETFDAHRFLRLRTTDAPDPIGYQNREQYQFVSITKEHMNFGWGRHACAGRFFAANEIKLIVVYLLTNYDLKLPEDSSTAFEAWSYGAGVMPDAGRTILVRKST